MSVYVDAMFEGGGTGRLAGRWCHMWADSLDESHAMAKAIGMRRSWFQNKPRFPHYDLRESKRLEAVNLGAVEIIGHRAFVANVNELRANGAFVHLAAQKPIEPK